MGKPADRKGVNKSREIFLDIAVFDFFPELQFRLHHRYVGAVRPVSVGAGGAALTGIGRLGRRFRGGLERHANSTRRVIEAFG